MSFACVTEDHALMFDRHLKRYSYSNEIDNLYSNKNFVADKYNNEFRKLSKLMHDKRLLKSGWTI